MREKKIKQERKETVKLKFSPKVSHLEGSIVSSLSHREFNFAFPLSILRHTSSLFCVFLFLSKISLLAKWWWGHEAQVFAYLFCPKFRKDGDVLFVRTSTQTYFLCCHHFSCLYYTLPDPNANKSCTGNLPLITKLLSHDPGIEYGHL